MTSFEVHSWAPGKVLWLGGYSVLERPNVSFVTTIDQHVHAHIRPNRDDTVLVAVPQLSPEVIRSRIDTATGKLEMRFPPELRLLATSVELAMMYSVASGHRISGIDISTINDPAFSYRVNGASAGKKTSKSGMGSSAAAVVATVGGVMELFGAPQLVTQVHQLSQLAHSIATQKVGSGFDIAAATYGSVAYTRYSKEHVTSFPAEYSKDDVYDAVKGKWDYTIESVEMPEAFRPVIANFVGDAAITVNLVKAVNAFKASSPAEYARLIGEINDHNVVAIDALRELARGADGVATERFRGAFEEARVRTKRLGELSGIGVEPEDLTALIEDSKRAGAFVAKSPGAGGKDSIAALCRTEDDQRTLSRMWRARPELDVLNVGLQKKGLQVSRSVS